jgi:hypothetical protein
MPPIEFAHSQVLHDVNTLIREAPIVDGSVWKLYGTILRSTANLREISRHFATVCESF